MIDSLSGPNGVTSSGRWAYAGDGDSTLKVIDQSIGGSNAIVQSISTGGTTRLDEMGLTTDGMILLAVNSDEDPPFATLFQANGPFIHSSNVTKIIKIDVSGSIIPSGFGLKIGQPVWEPSTNRFYTSIPIIAQNPPGCNFDGGAGPITCDGGLLVTDRPTSRSRSAAHHSYRRFFASRAPLIRPPKPGSISVRPANRNASTGACGPNGITVGPNDNLLLGLAPVTTRSTRSPRSSMPLPGTLPMSGRYHRRRRGLVQRLGPLQSRR